MKLTELVIYFIRFKICLFLLKLILNLMEGCV